MKEDEPRAAPPDAVVMTITLKEAAQRLGLSVRRVRFLCEQNRIQGARKPARDWLVPDPPIIIPPQAGRPRDAFDGDATH